MSASVSPHEGSFVLQQLLITKDLQEEKVQRVRDCRMFRLKQDVYITVPPQKDLCGRGVRKFVRARDYRGL